MRYTFSVICLFLLSFIPTELVAQTFPGGSRAAGMGQAYTAVGTGTDGLFHNPAGIAHAIMYSVDGRYSRTPSGNVLNASIVDSKTNPNLSAGLSYSYFLGSNAASDIKSHDVRGVIAIPAVPEKVSIGVGGRWIRSKQEGMGSKKNKTVETINGITLDVGVLFQVVEMLNVGLAGQNLIDVCPESSGCKNVAPTRVTGGASFGKSELFTVSSDVGINLTSSDTPKPLVDLGAEYMIDKAFPLRLGYQYRSLNSTNFLTTGLGWRSEKAGLDLAYRADPSDAENFFVTTTISVYF